MMNTSEKSSTNKKMPKRSDSSRFRSPSISLLGKKTGSTNIETTPVLKSSKQCSNISKQQFIADTKTKSKNSHLFGSNLELSSTGNLNLISERLGPTTQQTPIVSNRPTTSNSGGGLVSSGKSSFVNKHLLVQRRKTIHDIINLNVFSTILSSPKKSESKKHLSSSIVSDKKLDLDELNSLKASRDLLLQGSVHLLNQYGKQERHLFLFNDLLIIAKQKSENNFKIKYRVLLSDIWLSECFEAIYWQYKAHTSIVIGWPPAVNYILEFNKAEDKNLWLDKLKDLIRIQKEKDENSILNIKISYNTDNSGTTAPTQYSQSYTKTVQVKPNETALQLVDRCKNLFNLAHTDRKKSAHHQLWLKISANEPLIPLIGHEFPYAIKMNNLRETGASVFEENDETCKFVLIDNNNKKNSFSHDMEPKTKTGAPPKGVNLAPHDMDKLYRLRKKIFWNKNSSSSRNLDSLLLDQQLDGVLVAKKNRDSKNQANSIRSNSLHHVYQNYNDIQPKSSKKNSSTSSSLATSTLRPLYHKLKKPHLFGVKLEKICGPYSATNCRLPLHVMNLMEKVANEGVNAMMIFRKSASAKLKKTYRDKIDSNQMFNYDEMNVHIAALLLKEFLRDYPDGIIGYHLFNDCVKTLTIKSQDQQLKAIKAIINRLPKWNYVCLKHFMCLFHLISLNSSVNKMDVHNISVCVAPSLFHKIDKPSDVETNFKSIAFVEFLIKNLSELFGEDTAGLLNKPPKILIEINSDSSSHVSKSNESICSNKSKHRDIAKMLNLVNFKSKQSLIVQKTKSRSGEAPKTHSISDINDLLSNSGSVNSEPKQPASFNSNENVSTHDFIFDEDESSVYEASTDDEDDDDDDDDDEDIVCETKKTKLFTKRNLFKIKSNSKNFNKPKTNKHDLSSNTLSVDSGLSVPTTTTTSDPESEKSANLKKSEDGQLKRQKRMITLLNTDNDLVVRNESKNEQLMENFLRKNSQRFSLKSMAPLAPHKANEIYSHNNNNDSVDTNRFYSLPISSESKSTVTELKPTESKVKVHNSRKSVVKVTFDKESIENDVFKNAIQTGCGDVTASMNACVYESPKRRHSSMVYVGQSSHFNGPTAPAPPPSNSKNLVANLFNGESNASPVRCVVKRSLSLKNEEDESKSLKIPVTNLSTNGSSVLTSTSFISLKKSSQSIKTNRKSILNVAEENSSVHRLSMDAGAYNKFKNMDDNNNDNNSKSIKCLNELELAGVTWSVPNIRKQFERAGEAKRVESYVAGRRKTINIEAGLADKNRFITHRTTYI